MIAAGGGGIPTMYEPGTDRKLAGVEAVIDKDLCSELLARELDADLFVMATDADGGLRRLGQADARGDPPREPRRLWQPITFPAGSMGPKVEAACHFAEATGKRAAIGALADLAAIMEARAGTTITKEAGGIEWAPSPPSAG